MAKFAEVFSDETKRGYKIPTSEYLMSGKHPIIDQGYGQIAGYTDLESGAFTDVPAIIFGDHTRIVKYVDTPFFLGADGVKVLKIKTPNADYKYLFYFLQNAKIPNTGYNRHFKWLKELEVPLPSIDEQRRIAAILDKVTDLINKRRAQLDKLDLLVKSRFAEMFEKNNYPLEPLANNVIEMFIGPFGSSLKNEFFVDEEDGFCMVYEQKHAIQKTMDVPTRYVPKSKYEELKRFSVIGGDIIVSCRGTIGEIYIVPDDAPLGIMHSSIMKIRLNTEIYNQKFFVFALEQYMAEHNAEANGSGVKMAVSATVLGKADFAVPPIDLQNQFAAFIEQTNKSKSTIQKSLNKLETLKKSLMQQYFG